MKICEPHCVCKCNSTGCECWDGIAIVKMLRISDEDYVVPEKKLFIKE